MGYDPRQRAADTAHETNGPARDEPAIQRLREYGPTDIPEPDTNVGVDVTASGADINAAIAAIYTTVIPAIKAIETDLYTSVLPQLRKSLQLLGIPEVQTKADDDG